MTSTLHLCAHKASGLLDFIIATEVSPGLWVSGHGWRVYPIWHTELKSPLVIPFEEIQGLFHTVDVPDFNRTIPTLKRQPQKEAKAKAQEAAADLLSSLGLDL